MPFRYEKSDKTATITFDNPPVNVLTPELHRDLYHILKDFLSDDAISVGILTGAGQRAFCAGDDVKTIRPKRTQAEVVKRYLSQRSDTESMEYPGWESEILQLAMNRFKPIVAAVNGHCMGQGMLYLLQLTDIRIAASNASFGLPEIAYGMGGAGGLTRLARQIPPVGAMWLALTGERFDAQTALRYHLINEVVQPEELQARAKEVAGLISRHPQLALRTEMETSYRAQDMTREQAVAYSANLYRLQRVAFDGQPAVNGFGSTAKSQQTPEK